jgi:hypothetical protein
VVNSINQSGGTVIGYNFNPIEKLIELYEKQLEEKQVIIKQQAKEIKSLLLLVKR